MSEVGKRRLKIGKIERSIQGNDVNFLKIDKISVEQRRSSADDWLEQKNWEILERGDSAGVIIYNWETDQIILTRQFRAPLMNRLSTEYQEKLPDLPGEIEPKLYLLETVAGIIRSDETPEQTVVRETLEEVGYQLNINQLVKIGWFYPSPGATSERICMFYAAVSCANEREGEGGGVEADGEIIEIEKIQSHDFFERIKNNEIRDSKILVSLDTLKREVAGNKNWIAQYGIGYEFNLPDINTKTHIRLRRGDIKEINNVSIWVNSENSLMEMDQFVGKSISSRVRSLGAKQNENRELEIDLVGDALRREYYKRGAVKVRDILITTPGELRRPPYNVKELLHVASVEGKVGVEVKTKLEDVRPCVLAVLIKAEKRNLRKCTVMQSSQRRSILLPMIGAGNGGLEFEKVFQKTVQAVISYVKKIPDTTLREIHLAVFKECEFVAAREYLDALNELRISPRAPEL